MVMEPENRFERERGEGGGHLYKAGDSWNGYHILSEYFWCVHTASVHYTHVLCLFSATCARRSKSVGDANYSTRWSVSCARRVCLCVCVSICAKTVRRTNYMLHGNDRGWIAAMMMAMVVVASFGFRRLA